LTEKKRQIPEDIADFIFVGKNGHEASLNGMLDFLEFIIIGSNQQVSLGT
jgi:hypothetical protein